MAAKRHWLVKSEPDVYSIEDLERDGKTSWDGVRNYRARNIMRDEMRVGDRVLFYHSNASPPGVAGVAKVASAPYADPTQFDETDDHYDPKANPEAPRWFLVDVAFVERFPSFVGLDRIKADERFAEMALLKLARLSVQPVAKQEFDLIVRMGRKG